MSRQPAPSRARAPWRADLRRSRQLFSDFRVEQTDPARFYGAWPRDSVGQLSGYLDLAGATMLDVGGGPGFFRDAFQAAGRDVLGARRRRRRALRAGQHRVRAP